MNEKLKNHFLKFGPRKFVAVTVMVLLILDVLNSYYLKLWWVKRGFAELLLEQSMKINGMSAEDFNPATLSEWTGFYNNIFYFFLLLILVNNLFFYLFYLRKKLWAQGYVLFYTLTAGIFAITFIFDDTNVGVGWTIYNSLTFFIYIYLYLGVKLLKNETTLAREKKGR